MQTFNTIEELELAVYRQHSAALSEIADKARELREEIEANAHRRAVEMFDADNASRARAVAAFDRKPNPFTLAAVKMGRVPRDYKPLGVPARSTDA